MRDATELEVNSINDYINRISVDTGMNFHNRRGDKMKIIVELQLSSPYKLTAKEIEKDLRLSEDQIGWDYDYLIKSVKVSEE